MNVEIVAGGRRNSGMKVMTAWDEDTCRTATIDEPSVPYGMTRVVFEDSADQSRSVVRFDDRDCALLAAARWVIDGKLDE